MANGVVCETKALVRSIQRTVRSEVKRQVRIARDEGAVRVIQEIVTGETEL